MMDQTHIGYTSWRDPETNVMPAVQTLKVPAEKLLGVFPEHLSTGCQAAGQASACELLPFDPVNRQVRTVDLAPLGSEPVNVRLSASAPWVRLSLQSGTISADTTVTVGVDWDHVPSLPAEATVSVAPEGQPATPVKVHLLPIPPQARGFVENAGIVAIDAEHTSHRESANGVRWETLPGFGPTLSGIESFPVTAPSTLPGSPQSCVEYDFTTLTAGARTLEAILAPTLAFLPEHRLRYTVQLDNKRAQTIDAWQQNDVSEWTSAVSDGVRRSTTSLGKLAVGPHTLRVCRVDAGVVLERLLIFAEQPQEYLGPRESSQFRGR